MTTPTEKKDHWSTEAYTSTASFVPKLTSQVLTYLDVQPTDRILDIGCGDGQLTAQIAANASSGSVLGIDSSPSFIATAKDKYFTSTANCSFLLHDARTLASCPEAMTGAWDKIFSNAAMHWILRDRATTPPAFFAAVYRALRPGGKFVFEMGGHGNVAEVQTALQAAMVHVGGVTLAQAREASPWYFPSPEAMEGLLREAGFEVEKCYVEYRPTKLTEAKEDGTGGIEGWVRLMGAELLEVVEEGRRDAVVREVCEGLENVITKEDGSKWIGYVRLRAVAVKK